MSDNTTDLVQAHTALDAANEELAALREIRQQHHDGIFPDEIRHRFRRILSEVPGLGGMMPRQLEAFNAADVAEVIEYMSVLLGQQYKRTEQAEDELARLNQSITAVGELILRATEQASSRRNHL